MDIFNTVVSAIDLAEKISRVIDDFKKAPERLRRLQFDVISLQQTLERLKQTEVRGKDEEIQLEVEVKEIQKILINLQNSILQCLPKPKASVLSRSLRSIRTQMKIEDLTELADELQKRKASLALTVNMLVLRTVANVDIALQDRLAPPGYTEKPSTEKASPGFQTAVVSITPLDRLDFLDALSAPNYAEDELRVKDPSDGTATWIYDRQEYSSWLDDTGCPSLHLIGKMGSGKSVLMKSLTKKLKQAPIKDDSCGSAILYYFCTCVNRTDTSSTVLRGLIAQFVKEHGEVYEATLSTSDLLKGLRAGESGGLSFESLWHIFAELIRGSHLSHVYCVIDALDECDLSSLDDLLRSLQKLAKDASKQDTKLNLLFSSREYTRILDALDDEGECLRLYMSPDLVASDIRVAMHGDLQVRHRFRGPEINTRQLMFPRSFKSGLNSMMKRWSLCKKLF